MAEVLLIAAGALALYLATGWVIAVRRMPRAWTTARREWATGRSIRESVKAETVCMILFWLVYLPAIAINRRLDSAIDAGDPVALREKIAERDARIRQLERELGMRPA